MQTATEVQVAKETSDMIDAVALGLKYIFGAKEEKMQLEFGKTYENRDGKERTIVGKNCNRFSKTNPYLDESGRSYQDNGQYNSRPNSEDNWDLIKEVEKEMQIEVGKTYERGNGRKRKIVKHSSSSLYPYEDANGSTYTRSGTYYLNKDSEYNLIKEVEEKLQISKSNFYVSRDGRKIKIYTVESEGHDPIHGAVLIEGVWESRSWESCGKYTQHCERNVDIVGLWVEPKKIVKRYAYEQHGVYPGGFGYGIFYKDSSDLRGYDRVPSKDYEVEKDA